MATSKAKRPSSDLEKYVVKRKAKDLIFAEDFDSGYADFKIGVLLRQARESAGLTQEQIAERIGTKKSVISRIENHADNVTLTTLKLYAKAVGRGLHIRLVVDSEQKYLAAMRRNHHRLVEGE